MKQPRTRYQVRALSPAMGRLWAAIRERGQVRRGEFFGFALAVGLDPSHAHKLAAGLMRRHLIERAPDGAWQPARLLL